MPCRPKRETPPAGDRRGDLINTQLRGGSRWLILAARLLKVNPHDRRPYRDGGDARR